VQFYLIDLINTAVSNPVSLPDERAVRPNRHDRSVDIADRAR
jgi:hypothetical protein